MNQKKTIDGKTGAVYQGTTVPIYDPGEPFGDMAQQIIGSTSVPSQNPYNTEPWPPDSQTLMQGFTLNYSQLKGPLDIEKVPAANYPDVMNYLTPKQLPVSLSIHAKLTKQAIYALVLNFLRDVVSGSSVCLDFAVAGEFKQALRAPGYQEDLAAVSVRV